MNLDEVFDNDRKPKPERTVAQKQVTIILNIRTGRTWRTALDVLDLAGELFDKLPDWMQAEREEIKGRCAGLVESITAELADQVKRNAK